MTAPDRQTRRTVVLLAVAGFWAAVSIRVCDPLLPRIAATFSSGLEPAAATVSMFAAAYGLTQILYGPLGDRFGKLRTIAGAATLCVAGNLACVLADSLDALVWGRALAGAGTAGIVPLTMAWIGDHVDYDQRQITLARYLTGSLLGMSGGQLIGGLIGDFLDWRAAFVLIGAAFALLAVLLWRTALRHPSSHARAGAGFLSGIRIVLRRPWARVVLVTVFIEGVLVYGSLPFVPSYLHYRFDISLTLAGAVLALFGIGGLAYTTVARTLLARLGERGLARAGGVTIAVGFLLVALADDWRWAIPGSLIIGGGFYMLHNTLQVNATQMAPQARGTAVALFALLLFLGQTVGVLAGSPLAHDRWLILFTIPAAGVAVLGFSFAGLLTRRPASSE